MYATAEHKRTLRSQTRRKTPPARDNLAEPVLDLRALLEGYFGVGRRLG